MEEELIKISKKQLQGMMDTIEILQNPSLMKQIIESEENIKNNDVKEFNF